MKTILGCQQKGLVVGQESKWFLGESEELIKWKVS